MAGVVPDNFTVWSSRGSPSYRPAEGHLLFAGRVQDTPGDIPVVFCHGFALTIALMYDGMRDANYLKTWQAIAGGARTPVLTSDQGGPSTWGIDDVVAPSGAIDDLLDWANNPASSPPFRTSETKVALLGESMGCLNALGWAWRNPGRVVAIVLRAPVVALEAFHDRNAGLFGSIIESAYGGLAAYTAALPTHDPMQNLDLIRPFGHRIQLWAGTDDELIPPEEVQAFAELVGAEYHEIPGLHADLVNTPPDQVGFFFLETIRSHKQATIAWEPTDWGRLEDVFLTSGSGTNTYSYSTDIGVRGRRGVVATSAGSDGNNRRVHLLSLDEFSAVDTEMYSVWYSGDTTVGGQQGHAMRAVIDEDAGTYSIPMAWQNILFGIPWIMNLAVWSGTLGANDLALNGIQTATLEGLRVASGGVVLASSRVGGIATYQVSAGHNVHVGDLVDVQDTITLDGIQFVTSVTPTSFSFALAGPDEVSGGGGTYGNQARCFPYQVRSRIVGTSPAVMQVKAWPFGYDEPAYGDPLWGMSWTDPGSFAFSGYGRAGQLVAHVGANASVRIGLTTMVEL